MGQGARRGKVVALLVALALVAVAVPLAEPVWRWVTTKRTASSQILPGGHLGHGESSLPGGHLTRGYADVNRWGRESRLEETSWYVENGRKAFEQEWSDGEVLRRTDWDIEGKAFQQYRLFDDSGNEAYQFRHSPPWWWGVTDQTEPSIPEWMKDDAKWAKALEEAR